MEFCDEVRFIFPFDQRSCFNIVTPRCIFSFDYQSCQSYPKLRWWKCWVYCSLVCRTCEVLFSMRELQPKALFFRLVENRYCLFNLYMLPTSNQDADEIRYDKILFFRKRWKEAYYHQLSLWLRWEKCLKILR